MMSLAEGRRLIKKLQAADIVLVSEKGLVHSINRVLQGSRWHHVMLYVSSGRTIEATPRNGAHLCDLLHDITEKRYIAIKVLRNNKLKSSQRKKVVNTALKLFEGKKFSWKQYFKIILGRTMHWKMEGRKSLVCKPGHRCDTDTVVCSNMVAMAYYEAGFPLSERYMPEYIVPGDYERMKDFKVVFEKKLG